MTNKVEIDSAVLESICQQMEWPDQGGHSGYSGDGKWSFVSASVSLTGDQLNEVFAALGRAPVAIVPLGRCRTCASAENGRERGYRAPCLTCLRPKMSNWKPIPEAVNG